MPEKWRHVMKLFHESNVKIDSISLAMMGEIRNE